MRSVKKEWSNLKTKRRRVGMTKTNNYAPTTTASGVIKEGMAMNIKRKTLNVSSILWEKLHFLQEFDDSKSLNDILEILVNEKLENENLKAYAEFRINMRKATPEEEDEISRRVKKLSPEGIKAVKANMEK